MEVRRRWSQFSRRTKTQKEDRRENNWILQKQTLNSSRRPRLNENVWQFTGCYGICFHNNVTNLHLSNKNPTCVAQPDRDLGRKVRVSNVTLRLVRDSFQMLVTGSWKDVITMLSESFPAAFTVCAAKLPFWIRTAGQSRTSDFLTLTTVDVLGGLCFCELRKHQHTKKNASLYRWAVHQWWSFPDVRFPSFFHLLSCLH